MNLLDIIFPKICLGCGREGKYICDRCEVFLSEASNPVEAELRSGKVISIWDYEGISKKAISKIKQEGCYDVINGLVEKAFEKMELDLPADACITYVPMYARAERKRGFNQAALIAKRLGEVAKREVVPLLAKIKNNSSQINLGISERIENTKGAFGVLPSLSIKPRFILLVDDFYATGATLKECMEVLKAAGMQNIIGFTLARQNDL